MTLDEIRSKYHENSAYEREPQVLILAEIALQLAELNYYAKRLEMAGLLQAIVNASGPTAPPSKYGH